MTIPDEHRKPLGLCLSAGGALGFAHIGALEALLENGIEPDIISGCSMGAIVGAFYAAGMSPKDMIKVIEADKLYKVSKLMVLNPYFWKTGFSNHAAVKEVIHEIIPHNSFEKLQRRLFIGVTNLNTMECEIISSGNRLAEWVSASASIPGVFETFEDNGNYY
ncbi:MAG: patatin-like phospholipase family protein, partial [Bacteroidota bacterium]|nr:patatin-like phospholipase family protein [Bacteroidota bacterium]